MRYPGNNLYPTIGGALSDMSQCSVSLIALRDIIALLAYFYLAERGGVHVVKGGVHVAKGGVHLVGP